MRRPADVSVAEIVEEAVRTAVARSLSSINRAIQNAIDARVREELAKTKGPRRAKTRARRATPKELTRWVADRRARRVPNFVIEATDLDTKKKVVAKFGENAAFEKGKPLPKLLEAPVPADKGPKAKGPIVRRKKAAAA